MLQRMEAEVLFLDPADEGPCVAKLTELGFIVERLDWTDPHGPTVWVMARIDVEFDDMFADVRFFDWVTSIVEPLGGDVVKAGFACPPQTA